MGNAPQIHACSPGGNNGSFPMGFGYEVIPSKYQSQENRIGGAFTFA